MEIKIEPASSIVEAREDGTITLTFRRADGAEWVQPHTLDEALRLAERLTAAIQSVEAAAQPTETPAAEEASDKIACDIAAGRREIDPAAETVRVRAAHKDYNSRGRCREHWFRMVWRGEWQYFGEGRLPGNGIRASERVASTYGHVSIGDLVCAHDRGGPVDRVWLVTDLSAKPLKACKFAKRADGQLAITLPDGTDVVRPNPRQR